MVTIIELLCEGMEHVPFNSALVQVMRHAYSDHKIHFLAESTHLEYVKKAYPKHLEEPVWIAIDISPRHAKFSRRIATELQLLRQCQDILGENPNPLMLISSATPSSMYASLLLKKKVSRQYILHSGLRTLVGWRSRNPFIRAFDLNSAMRVAAKCGASFVLLEEPILNAVTNLVPISSESFALLEHPVSESEWNDEGPPPYPPLHLAFLGVASHGKNFPVFVRLACRVTSASPDIFRFHVIGRNPGRDDADHFGVFRTPPSVASPSREQYLRLLRNMHYVCLPYTTEQYSLSPSGVLLDAIAACKPIIALQAPIITSLFKRYGDIGFVCGSEEDLFRTTMHLTHLVNSRRYEIQLSNMRRLRKDRRPISVAIRYAEFISSQKR